VFDSELATKIGEQLVTDVRESRYDGRKAAAADGWTGHPPGLLQDDSRDLSRALASKPDAMRHAREAGAAIAATAGDELPPFDDVVQRLMERADAYAGQVYEAGKQTRNALESAMRAALAARGAQAEPAVDEREAFEKAIEPLGIVDMWLERDDAGNYTFARAMDAWLGWQARAALKGQPAPEPTTPEWFAHG
jgi:hypothetical protein